ncbi:hypothetical protein IAQ61_004035 [Plenodomus lingam]|uniref:uncharacterized protein n=1 Tax=Leptosphaeria maculans TaxID=5022 RepID=UPI00332D319F|nr:hypothetical protein IAQ61_004035 [Plenodomus lingam]
MANRSSEHDIFFEVDWDVMEISSAFTGAHADQTTQLLRHKATSPQLHFRDTSCNREADEAVPTRATVILGSPARIVCRTSQVPTRENNLAKGRHIISLNWLQDYHNKDLRSIVTCLGIQLSLTGLEYRVRYTNQTLPIQEILALVAHLRRPLSSIIDSVNKDSRGELELLGRAGTESVEVSWKDDVLASHHLSLTEQVFLVILFFKEYLVCLITNIC